jgi:hypothetical protein
LNRGIEAEKIEAFLTKKYLKFQTMGAGMMEQMTGEYY